MLVAFVNTSYLHKFMLKWVMMSVVIVLSGTGPNLLLFSQQWSASNPKPTVWWRAPFAQSLEPETLAKVQFLSFLCVSIKQNKNIQVFLILNMFTIFPFLFLSSATFLDRTSFTSYWRVQVSSLASSKFFSPLPEQSFWNAEFMLYLCSFHWS